MNKCDTNAIPIFDTPNEHFDQLNLFSGIQAEKVGHPSPSKKIKTV
jgi:hypothetical protein